MSSLGPRRVLRGSFSAETSVNSRTVVNSKAVVSGINY